MHESVLDTKSHYWDSPASRKQKVLLVLFPGGAMTL